MPLPYEIFVGLRYLRAKRRNRTISLNTFVSIAGITLGVAALIGTVGIMTGFKEDIQAKILGTTAHIIVQDRMKDGMTDYDAVADKVRQVPDVVAATPFVLKQVLLTTQTGVQGIVIRGIDPKREGTVTELAKNLAAGSLADLQEPIKVKQSPRTIRPVLRSRRKNPASFSGKSWLCDSGCSWAIQSTSYPRLPAPSVRWGWYQKSEHLRSRAFSSPACTNMILRWPISTSAKRKSFSTLGRPPRESKSR